MLGRITEVALFTERVEIKKADMSDTEIDKKIKEKLNKFMGVVDIEDVKQVDEVKTETHDSQAESKPE